MTNWFTARRHALILLMFTLALPPGLAAQLRPAADTDLTAAALLDGAIAAHGGREAWNALPNLSFWFITRNTGAPEPWLTMEAFEPSTGRSVMRWPVFEAQVWSDGERVWSRGWPLSMSPGFFSYLTSSFVTLPFLLDAPGVHLGEPETRQLPDDATDYLTVRVTFDDPGGHVPGNYYRMFFDPDTYEYRAIEFDITHPGLVQNPDQPLGPNVHVFHEYKTIGGVKIPSYYTTHGQNRRTGATSSADHRLFSASAERSFDELWGDGPATPGLVEDRTTAVFWTRSPTP